jgi:hypothetical protein
MIRVTTKILLIAWVAMVPALCLGGVLVHPCECPVEGCEDSANELGCVPEEKDGCGHESSCSGDPCAMLRVGQTAFAADLEMTLFVAPISIHDADIEIDRLAQAPGVRSAETPPRTSLPYPPSDLPLLI